MKRRSHLNALKPRDLNRHVMLVIPSRVAGKLTQQPYWDTKSLNLHIRATNREHDIYSPNSCQLSKNETSPVAFGVRQNASLMLLVSLPKLKRRLGL